MHSLQAGLLRTTSFCSTCGVSAPLCGCMILARRHMTDPSSAY